MKSYFFCATATVLLLPIFSNSGSAAPGAAPFVYESPHEFFGSGDFDGDGRMDIIIVDKESGKYRLGYQIAAGALSWVDCRPSDLKGIAGFSVGSLFLKNHDALAFASPDANQITLVDAASANAPSKPITIPFTAALGPNTVVAADGGSVAKTGLLDLYIGSIYNSPDPNLATLVRNDGAEYPKLSDAILPGPASHGNRLSLKEGQPEAVCLLVTGDKGDTFRAETLNTGKPVAVAVLGNLPAGSDYASGNFRGSPLREFIFYKPGQSGLTLRPVEEPSPGQLQLGKGDTFDLGRPVRRVVTLVTSAKQKLFVIFGEGEKAGVFDFDGAKAPTSVLTINATNELFTCAASLPEGFVAFTQPANGKFSNKYRVYKASGDSYAAGAFGSLPSLADNDNITIPDIHTRITSNPAAMQESGMKLYTNIIPGTRVAYVMVPIPGGEFVMGSPEGETGRKADEGPQHKVTISPFWMEQCEVTWNEYELFMYRTKRSARAERCQPTPRGTNWRMRSRTLPSLTWR